MLGLSLMPDEAFRQATYPLFEAGAIDVLEWSFDTVWDHRELPAWAAELITFYSEHERLLGHGVSFSILSADSVKQQQQWLKCAQQECSLRSYRHVSEHFGFMSSGSFHRSAPLPVPLNETTLSVGREGLKRLKEVVQAPVGLENLAFAFGEKDVAEQGAFLDQLLEPVSGFLLLDLHNLYCQACNFRQSAEQLIESYPLERVRELHVSGGSWSEVQSVPSHQPIRRDTHDGAVPEEVFALLELALQKCPNVDAVIFEQLSESMGQGAEVVQYRADFERLQQIVRAT